MKKLLTILTVVSAAALFFSACRSQTANEQKPLNYEDTVGLAQFQAWKAMNERTDPLTNYDARSGAGVKTVRTRRSGTMSSSSTNYAKTTKKKGWSKAAKYSAIGGGGGIILGAVVNKRNRVAGGVFGGILGGGLGYVLGRSQDKKDGRY